MAAQMGVAFSSQVAGVGIVAGGFYGCAGNHFQESMTLSKKLGLGVRSFLEVEVDPVEGLQGNTKEVVKLAKRNPLYQALQICMQDPARVIVSSDELLTLSANNQIDSITNLKKQRVYIYHGKQDSIVRPEQFERTKLFYIQNGIATENLKFELSEIGAHTYPTDKPDLNKCDSQGIPYISSCENDLAGKILSHLFNEIKLIKSPSAEAPQIKKISLDHFDRPSSIAKYGYIAASEFCLNKPLECRVHVALHGCEMADSFDPEFDERYQKFVKFGFLYMRDKATRFKWTPFLPVIEDIKPKLGTLQFAELSGYREYANSENKLMVLFPQTQLTVDHYPANPKACWDWYGWTGADYKTKTSKEMRWLNEWIQQVAQNPRSFIMSK